VAFSLSNGSGSETTDLTFSCAHCEKVLRSVPMGKKNVQYFKDLNYVFAAKEMICLKLENYV
jgi:hypothetical protein